MPQMFPMNWLLIFSVVILLFLAMVVCLYFSMISEVFYKPQQNNNLVKNFKYKW